MLRLSSCDYDAAVQAEQQANDARKQAEELARATKRPAAALPALTSGTEKSDNNR
jgi:hypothetical protein